MKAIKPVSVTDTNLLSHSVAETETGLAVWSGATTYAAGQRCFMTTGVHKIFESVAGGNLNNNPSTTIGYWIEISATNRWKMFDQAVGSATYSTSNIVVKFSLSDIDYVNSVAILDITGGTEIVIEVLSAADAVLWTATHSLTYWAEDVVPDWYWYFYGVGTPKTSLVVTDIPNFYNSRLQVTVKTAAASLYVGTIVFGNAVSIGDSQWGTSLGIVDYSKKETDVYGVTTVIQRVYARTMTCDCQINNSEIDVVYRRLAALRATPIVWIGGDGDQEFDYMTVYGFYKNFTINIPGPLKSHISIEIESLT